MSEFKTNVSDYNNQKKWNEAKENLQSKQAHGTGFVIDKVVILFMFEFVWLKSFELSLISDEPCLVLFQSKAL